MHSMAVLALIIFTETACCYNCHGSQASQSARTYSGYSTWRSRAEGFGVELVAACQLEAFPLWLMAQKKETAGDCSFRRQSALRRHPCSIEAQPNGDW